LYSGLASLWLVRERHWTALAIGIGLLVVVALVTLPLTGVDLWRQWLEGLNWYRQSQPILPNSLYGYGLPRYIPEWIGYAVGGIAVVLALLVRGREGLAWFGLATVVASPSLYAHGFIVALPAFLLLAPIWTWLALGITSVVPGGTFWFAVAFVGLAYVARGLRRRTGASAEPEPMDLLAGADGPWPSAPWRATAAPTPTTEPAVPELAVPDGERG
jgi:hypothetical protein